MNENRKTEAINNPATEEEIASLTNILGYGKANKKTIPYICAWLGVSRRDLRRIRQGAQIAGYPVISDHSGGYWLAENEYELRRYADMEYHRAKAIMDRITPMLNNNISFDVPV